MKKRLALPAVLIAVPFAAALLATLLIATSCLIDPRPVIDDGYGYTSFPEAEILGASFYLVMNDKDITGDDAGSIINSLSYS
jgi:hypothetical protein